MNRFFSILVITILCSLVACDNSVTIEPTDETHFIKYYGAGGSQFACDMITDTDGFVILANSDLDEDNRQVYLLKTDEFGNEMWSNTFGDVEREDARSIDATGSGGYVIAATIDDGSGSTDIKVWIVDQMGTPIDSAIYGAPGVSETVEKVTTTQDGGYIITGSTDEVVNGRLSSILILRTLPGTLTQLTENEWTTIHGEGTISSGSSIFEFNSEFFTLGTTDSDNPPIEGLKFIFFPLSNTGTAGNNTFYGEDDDQIAEKLLKTDGGFVLLGNTLNAGNSDIYIQKVSNGLAKQATLKITQRNIQGTDIVDTGLGYLIIGTETISPDDSNIYLTLIDKNPRVGTQDAIQSWERTFGGVNIDNGASGLSVLADGSIVFAGTVELGNQSKVALIKTNKNGDLNP